MVVQNSWCKTTGEQTEQLQRRAKCRSVEQLWWKKLCRIALQRKAGVGSVKQTHRKERLLAGYVVVQNRCRTTNRGKKLPPLQKGVFKCLPLAAIQQSWPSVMLMLLHKIVYLKDLSPEGNIFFLILCAVSPSCFLFHP